MKYDFYLIGICGTAMGSVAGLLKEKGFSVAGSDKRFYPPIGDMLKDLNIKTLKGYSEKNIIDTDIDKFIIGNAVSRGNPEVEYVLSNTRNYYSMTDIIKDNFLTDDKKVIAVSGTHGKTTTTSIIHWILRKKFGLCDLLVGGIPLNIEKSFEYSKDSKFFVIEGDEYDSAFFDKRPKFISYRPDVLVINNIEFDHADIYENLNEIKKQFRYLLRTVPKNGLVVFNGDDKNTKDIAENIYSKRISFGKNLDNDAILHYYKNEDNKFIIELVRDKDKKTIVSHLIGEHNIYNAAAAYLVCESYGVSAEEFSAYLEEFKGIARRINQYRLNSNQILIDDFAHHPTAVKTTIKGLKEHYSDYYIKTAYEPRSWTARTKLFQDRYIEAFEDSDEVYLPPIEDSQRFKDDIIDLEKLQNDLTAMNKKCYLFNDIDSLKDSIIKHKKEKEIILLLSNGDFKGLKDKILSEF